MHEHPVKSMERYLSLPPSYGGERGPPSPPLPSSLMHSLPDGGGGGNGGGGGGGWRSKKVDGRSDEANKNLWMQILKRGEEIYRQASDAQRRDFSIEEIKHVEFLASSILSEVRVMIASDPNGTNPTTTFTTHEMGELTGEEGSLKVPKRRGRPPIKKPMCCQECGTTETPEWRRGESGPNTLCNGCGLRYAKRMKLQQEESRQIKPPLGTIPFPSGTVPFPSDRGPPGVTSKMSKNELNLSSSSIKRSSSLKSRQPEQQVSRIERSKSDSFVNNSGKIEPEQKRDELPNIASAKSEPPEYSSVYPRYGSDMQISSPPNPPSHPPHPSYLQKLAPPRDGENDPDPPPHESHFLPPSRSSPSPSLHLQIPPTPTQKFLPPPDMYNMHHSMGLVPDYLTPPHPPSSLSSSLSSPPQNKVGLQLPHVPHSSLSSSSLSLSSPPQLHTSSLQVPDLAYGMKPGFSPFQPINSSLSLPHSSSSSLPIMQSSLAPHARTTSYEHPQMSNPELHYYAQQIQHLQQLQQMIQMQQLPEDPLSPSPSPSPHFLPPTPTFSPHMQSYMHQLLMQRAGVGGGGGGGGEVQPMQDIVERERRSEEAQPPHPPSHPPSSRPSSHHPSHHPSHHSSHPSSQPSPRSSSQQLPHHSSHSHPSHSSHPPSHPSSHPSHPSPHSSSHPQQATQHPPAKRKRKPKVDDDPDYP